jgi:hypothetical protein
LEHVSQSVAASSSRTTTSKCLMCYIEPIEPSEGKLNTPFSFRMNGVGGPFFISFPETFGQPETVQLRSGRETRSVYGQRNTIS